MVILRMLWLTHHNPKIDWITGEVKMTRCPEECGEQWRPGQGKLDWKNRRKRKQRRKQKRSGKKRRREKDSRS